MRDYLKGGTVRGRDWICSMSHRDAHRDTGKSIYLPSGKSEGLYIYCVLPLDVAKSHTLELRYPRMPELIIIYRLMNVYGKLRLMSSPVGDQTVQQMDQQRVIYYS